MAGPDPAGAAGGAGAARRHLPHGADQPGIRGARRRAAILATAASSAGAELDPDQAHLVRVVEYDMPDRVGNGTGELIVLLSTILDPAEARADELAAAYHQRWEEETGNDQLKTHLRGPGQDPALAATRAGPPGDLGLAARPSRISALITKAADAADLDPDRISFTRVLRITRRTATGTAGFPP